MNLKSAIIAGALGLGLQSFAAAPVFAPPERGFEEGLSPERVHPTDQIAGGSQTGGMSFQESSVSLAVAQGRVVEAKRKSITLNTGATDMMQINTAGVAFSEPIQEGQDVRVAFQDMGAGNFHAMRIWATPALQQNAGVGGSGRLIGVVRPAGALSGRSSGANDAIRMGDLGSGATGQSSATFGQGSGGPDEGTPSGDPQQNMTH